ncbi:MAG: hypothetical protein Q7R81_04300 [Candidatus Peregrinibacteria bacterium]|nr:hypothetical protein [Candidatus Peregrinibacteria bacterium]
MLALPSYTSAFPSLRMRKLFIAILIAMVFGGGWGLLYFIFS